MHRPGDVAGLFDLAVWPAFRRRGPGRELLAVAVASARDRGVDRVVLTATPEGSELDAAAGFTRLGEGRTWWWHRSPRDPQA